MLFITGTLNGVTYPQDTAIDPNVIAKFYKLQPPPADNTESRVLKVAPERIIEKDGQKKHFSSWSPQARLSLNDGDNSFILRYATSKNMNGKGESVFTPSNVTLSGAAGFNRNAYDLFVFMCCHPEVKGGPFYDENNKPFYEIYDAVSEQTKSQTKSQTLQDMLQEIRDMSEENLVLKARAIGIQGTYAEVFPLVIARMTQDIDAFARTWNDDTTTFYGQVMDAIAKNVVTQATFQGVNSWVWGSSTPNAGIRICSVGPNEDAVRKLITFLSNNENAANIMPALLTEINYKPDAQAPKAKNENQKGDFITKFANSKAITIEGPAIYFEGNMIAVIPEGKDAEFAIRDLYEQMDADAKKSWRMKFINAAKK